MADKKIHTPTDPVAHHDEAGCRFLCMHYILDALEECSSMCCETAEDHAACCACQEHLQEALLCHLKCCPTAEKPS